jgi:hypothetical protein
MCPFSWFAPSRTWALLSVRRRSCSRMLIRPPNKIYEFMSFGRAAADIESCLQSLGVASDVAGCLRCLSMGPPNWKSRNPPAASPRVSSTALPSTTGLSGYKSGCGVARQRFCRPKSPQVTPNRQSWLQIAPDHPRSRHIVHVSFDQFMLHHIGHLF